MFWKLVWHELKLKNTKKEQSTKQKKITKFIYAGVFVIIGLFFLTKLSLAGEFQPIMIWNISYGLPFAWLAVSRGAMKRELRSNTIGWWLSLPLSRQALTSAKFLAACWRSFLTFSIIFLLGILAFCYAWIFDSNLQLQDFLPFLQIGLVVGFIMIVIGPFINALGIFMGTLEISEYRFLLSIFWLAFWGIWVLLISAYSDSFVSYMQQQSFPFPSAAVIAWIPCWLLAYVFIRISAFLLEKKLT